MVHELLTIIIVHDKLKSVLSSSQYNHYGYRMQTALYQSLAGAIHEGANVGLKTQLYPKSVLIRIAD